MHVHDVTKQPNLASRLDAVGAVREHGRPATEMRERGVRQVAAGLAPTSKVEGSGDAGNASFEAAILLHSDVRASEASHRPVV